jgi:hypothetical protein
MQQITLKNVRKGEYFKRSLTTNVVYIRGEYVREAKKYSCTDAEDINKEMLIDGEKLVYIGFTY